MRFKHKQRPKNDDIRFKVFFAWMPIRIGLETRWLERVSVKQRYFYSSHPLMIGYNGWGDISFEQ